MRWNLDDLYPSFESTAFKADFARISALVDDQNEWGLTGLAGSPPDVLTEAVKKFEAYRMLLDRMGSYCVLRQSVDADDAAAQAWLEKLSALDAEAVQSVTRFRQYLLALGEGLNAAIQARPELSEHSFFFADNRNHARYMLPSEVERALSLMEITGSQAWSNLRNTLTSTATAELETGGEPKTLTLPMIRNLLYDTDSDVRRTAYEAEIACCAGIERSAAAALNGIKGESITKCRLKGFPSPLDQTLLDSRMDRETLDALTGAMEEYLPEFRRYLKAKAALLGKGALPFYDLFAPVGSFERKYTLGEARKYLVDGFRSLSGKMADFIDEAFEKQWLDTEPRRGKQGGAFCNSIHTIGQPRILSNFDGSFSSVTTLAHELGHGYHGMCLNGVSILNADYPMPLAETASIFNETFIYSRAIETAGNAEEKLALLDEQLKDETQVIVDILSRYYFESDVFARRSEGALSAEDLKAMMLDAQRRAYGDGLDGDMLHPYMWVVKGHYYMGINFYNFPYAFGLLFGLGVFRLYKELGEAFLPIYDALLTATGSNDIATVCAGVGIDVHDKSFWRKSLGIVKEKVDAYVTLACSD